MSLIGSALRAVAVVTVIGSTYYVGKTHGRYCEAKDGRMTIALGNQDALLRLDALAQEIKATTKEVSDDTQLAIKTLLDSLYKRIDKNVTARVVWDDLVDDINEIKKLAGLDH